MGYSKHDNIVGGQQITGVYAMLVDAQYRGPDPRIYVGLDDTVTPVTAHMSTQSPLQAKLDQGLPVVVPKWKITGNWRRGLRQEYPWLNGGGSVRVYPDDTVEEIDDDPDVM